MLATYQEVHKSILVWLPRPNKLRLVGRQEDANLMMFFVPSISGDTGAARVLHAFTAQVMEVSSLCTSQSCVAFHQDFLRFSVDFQQPWPLSSQLLYNASNFKGPKNLGDGKNT